MNPSKITIDIAIQAGCATDIEPQLYDLMLKVASDPDRAISCERRDVDGGTGAVTVLKSTDVEVDESFDIHHAQSVVSDYPQAVQLLAEYKV